MVKKVVVIGVIVVIFVLALGIYSSLKPAQVIVGEYSKNPQDWVVEKEGNVKEILVEQATEGMGFIDREGVQYRTEEIETVFAFDGVYKGDYFGIKNYYDPDTGEKKMSITNEIIPGNGILEGYIVEKIKDNEAIAYIFLEDEWITQAGPEINIIWGSEFENIQQFSFNNEISEGIYMDQIKDDITRFDDSFRTHVGGIVVGNADLRDVEQGNLEGLTLIRAT